ncbi:UNVERIFIED_CONTAM: hypothetical protein K2H54_077411 [Gekko kuhli]
MKCAIRLIIQSPKLNFDYFFSAHIKLFLLSRCCMGKTDPLGPKALAKRIKSKGLQKLRWYCQPCQRQCRDENGFRCHCTSESHQRRLLLASEDPRRFVDRFSEAFREDFLELLRRRFGTRRVPSNVVYNEYIRRREHVHMNATRWETLAEFTTWLGREGHCKVEETPGGWCVQYVDREPEATRRQQEQERRKKQRLDDEERTARFVQEQVRRGLEGKAREGPAHTELKRGNDEGKVAFSWNRGAGAAAAPQRKTTGMAPTAKRKATPFASGDAREKKRKTALEEIREFEEPAGADSWLQPDIVVKIVTRKLGEKHHREKAVVKEVIDKYAAVVEFLDSGDKVKLGQAHLETVIPAPGKKVLVLNGGYRGNEATLVRIDEKTFSATILLESGPLTGRQVEGVPYEDISKRA